jgi:(1->4)-alpha-D-glucan 1-alpha-D-glucosylmutase
MRVGMYHDLAVGVDADGFETWARPELYALDARIGAPPDAFCPNGQDWGLPPIIPREMRRDGYQSFIDVLRANMRFGGALRIDHVMGLMRLFWVPAGGRPADGAYVRYPFSDLLAILALESQRNQCLIIGEDLGTVPDEVRDALRPADVLSYRVFYFEKDSHGEFRPPEEYPAQALVTVSTHDLPTLVGFWRERDIAVRDEHGLFPSPDARDAQRIERARDRERLLRALSRAELSSSNVELTPTSRPELTFDSILAVHALLARTPSRLFLFQFEDVLGESDQANLPGTTVEYPNWRRKLATNLEDLAHDPRFGAFTQMLRGERGSGCVRLPPRGQPSE